MHRGNGTCNNSGMPVSASKSAAFDNFSTFEEVADKALGYINSNAHIEWRLFPLGNTYLRFVFKGKVFRLGRFFIAVSFIRKHTRNLFIAVLWYIFVKKEAALTMTIFTNKRRFVSKEYATLPQVVYTFYLLMNQTVGVCILEKSSYFYYTAVSCTHYRCTHQKIHSIWMLFYWVCLKMAELSSIVSNSR